MRRILSLGAAAGLVACSGGAARPPVKPTNQQLPGNQTADTLPDIPAKIVTTTSAPMDGNVPADASPMLDIMRSENEREMAALSKTSDPAYYLAYQLVEQRIVSLEAEGGAIVDDRDDTQRNLDVDVRVGSPHLDNTRQISDDTNGLNAPLTRRGHGAVRQRQGRAHERAVARDRSALPRGSVGARLRASGPADAGREEDERRRLLVGAEGDLRRGARPSSTSTRRSGSSG